MFGKSLRVCPQSCTLDLLSKATVIHVYVSQTKIFDCCSLSMEKDYWEHVCFATYISEEWNLQATYHYFVAKMEWWWEYKRKSWENAFETAILLWNDTALTRHLTKTSFCWVLNDKDAMRMFGFGKLHEMIQVAKGVILLNGLFRNGVLLSWDTSVTIFPHISRAIGACPNDIGNSR